MARLSQFIKLESLEREFLNRIVKKGTIKAREQNRCRILLYNDSGKTAREISSLLSISYVTVTQTLKRYRDSGLLSALHDNARSGAPKKLTPELEAHVSALACSKPPSGYASWTVEMLKDEIVRLELVPSISKTSVHTILKKAT